MRGHHHHHHHRRHNDVRSPNVLFTHKIWSGNARKQCAWHIVTARERDVMYNARDRHCVCVEQIDLTHKTLTTH